MPKINTIPIGAASELTACAWLLSEGYEVFRNVAPAGPIDLIAFKDGLFLFIDVKTAALTKKKDGTPTGVAPKTMRKNQESIGVTFLYVTRCGKCFFDRDEAYKFLCKNL